MPSSSMEYRELDRTCIAVLVVGLSAGIGQPEGGTASNRVGLGCYFVVEAKPCRN
jgi:hypothetical protein